MSRLEKNYDPKAIEDKWYQSWKDRGYFRGDASNDAESYCIVIPPPNVTGILHMGHALNNTIQDMLIRTKRMQGRNTVWVPGTDHASIATEQKVVNLLKEQGIDKRKIGRDAFLEHAWAWKEKYGSFILNQLEKLGCSCDWDRLRFTMDDKYHKSVLESFVRLYEKGYIYRGHRLVNWCPVSLSAISDEEVNHKEVNGHLWHFRYPIVDSEEYLVVATTRPETMLGDTGVAVHPEDKRYKELIGQKIKLPLVGREIPIIGDELVDPEFGTGCVKVTPAHDQSDFVMGERHKLPFINIMHPDASLNDQVPEAYRGLSREAARKQVVKDLDAEDLLEKTEDYLHKVGYSERGHVPIEFYMSEQWFMKMDELAKPAIQVVKEKKVKIHPEHWVKTYLHWMENIQDWCISRQLWWGHRIPVWYKKGADKNDPAQRHVSIDGPSDPENWEQDEDVLDTWASSWLWPFGVFDWPNESADLKRYYPGNTLVTGPDIIFFWVARMIMAGIEFMDGIPFEDVYIHGIVRDDDGRKMSKSLGNSLDPLETVDKYSADALRFSLIMITATGSDVFLSDDKFEIGRNFATKIWNAARFMQLHYEEVPEGFANPDFDPELLSNDDKHILAKLQETIVACDDYRDRFRFNDLAGSLYEFVWHQYCDWYVEYSKDILYGENEARKANVLKVMHYVYSNVLRLLHPLMPFVTEELWQAMSYTSLSESVVIAPWPEKIDDAHTKALGIDSKVVEFVDQKHDLIRVGRQLRADYNILPKQEVEYIIRPSTSGQVNLLKGDSQMISAMLKAKTLVIAEDFQPDRAMPSMISQLGAAYMPIDGLINVEEEVVRLTTQLDKIRADLEKINRKLSNENFVRKAPEKVVNQQKAWRDEASGKAGKLEEIISTLKQQAASA